METSFRHIPQNIPHPRRAPGWRGRRKKGARLDAGEIVYCYWCFLRGWLFSHFIAVYRLCESPRQPRIAPGQIMHSIPARYPVCDNHPPARQTYGGLLRPDDIPAKEAALGLTELSIGNRQIRRGQIRPEPRHNRHEPRRPGTRPGASR